MGKQYFNYYDLPSVNLAKYAKVSEQVTEPVKVVYGEPAYLQMDISDEVKNNELSLKYSLKSSNLADIISEYSNLYYYIKKDMF